MNARSRRRRLRFSLGGVLLLLAGVPCVTSFAQDTKPAANPFETKATASEMMPLHPDGDTPIARMLSLAHTDGLPAFDRVEVYAISFPDRSGDERPKTQATNQTFPCDLTDCMPIFTPTLPCAAMTARRLVTHGDPLSSIVLAVHSATIRRMGSAFTGGIYSCLKHRFAGSARTSTCPRSIPKNVSSRTGGTVSRTTIMPRSYSNSCYKSFPTPTLPKRPKKADNPIVHADHSVLVFVRREILCAKSAQFSLRSYSSLACP